MSDVAAGREGRSRTLRLGDRLLLEGLVTQLDIDAAVAEQQRRGGGLGDVLVAQAVLTEEQLLGALARHLEVPCVKLDEQWIDPAVAALLPEATARRFSAVVIEESERGFLVAMADPGDLPAYDEIRAALPKPVRLALARKSDLDELVNQTYRRTEELSTIVDEISEQISGAEEIDLSTLTVGGNRSSAPALRLLQTLFEDAVQVGASDIHIEPQEFSMRIRTRKDGILQEQIFRQGRIHSAIVSLLKLMSGLNITERRLPQDGRFQARVQGRSIDVRLSTLPQQYGEGVVLRLLDQSDAIATLDGSGMPAAMLERFRGLIGVPYGMILVSGPTGSGKSTTIYGALAELNRPEVKIITVEDPVEYRIDRLNQVQVREDIGLTFARILRTALRQDPDVVMVGEMRDEETAEIGLRAAVTGHLVFSTLHTNDAVSTATRLIDMGVESYMLAAALRAIVAQRLLRRICTSCREPVAMDDRERAWLRNWVGDEADAVQLHRGRGCSACGHTGYAGRMAIFELLELRGEMVEALRRADGALFAALCEADETYAPMNTMALDFVRRGLTTVEEVFRVLGHEDEKARSGLRPKTHVPARAGRSKLDPYRAYLDAWLEEAGDEAPSPSTLHRRLLEQGFDGSLSLVRRYLAGRSASGDA